jgi:hypothetical protein
MTDRIGTFTGWIVLGEGGNWWAWVRLAKGAYKPRQVSGFMWSRRNSSKRKIPRE